MNPAAAMVSGFAELTLEVQDLETVERFYRDVSSAIAELAPRRNIRLIINEWNTALPVPRQQKSSETNREYQPARYTLAGASIALGGTKRSPSRSGWSRSPCRPVMAGRCGTRCR